MTLPTPEQLFSSLDNLYTDAVNGSKLYQDPPADVTLRNGDTVPNLRKRLEAVTDAADQLGALDEAVGQAQAARAAAEAQAAILAGVQAYGAVGDGVTDDTAAFATALAATTGPVYVPWTAQHYALSALSTADRTRLWGPGVVMVASVETLISSTPWTDTKKGGLSLRGEWTPESDFASVDVGEGPLTIDVKRKGSVGSYGWASIIGEAPDGNPSGVSDHLLSAWLTHKSLTGGRGNAFWPAINSPASNLPGHAWTSGQVTGAEINFGNRFLDAGIKTTFDLTPSTAGMLIVPDVAPTDQGPNYWTVDSITIATPGVLSVAGHNFTPNMGVRLYANTGTLPTGLTDGALYYVTNPVAGVSFEVSATPGGPSIATSGSFGAGVRLVPSYPGTYALVFSKSVHANAIGTLMHVATNTIQFGGHAIYAHGGNGSGAMRGTFATLVDTWIRGIDFGATTFQSGIAIQFGSNHQQRWESTTGALIRGTATALDLSTGSGTGVGRLLSNNAARVAFSWADTGSAAALSFFGAATAVKQTITGSRGGNAALADLLTKLATIGLITDSTS